MPFQDLNNESSTPWQLLKPKKSSVTASLIIAFLLALLIHVFLFLYSPQVWETIFLEDHPHDKPLQVTYEPAPPPKDRYVEPNPSVEKPHEPPKTTNIAASSQIAAQEKPANTTNSSIPEIKDGEQISQKIIKGSLQESSLDNPQSEEQPEQLTAKTQKQTERALKNEADLPELLNAKIAKSAKNIKEGEGEGLSFPNMEEEDNAFFPTNPAKQSQVTENKVAKESHPQPRPRPHVNRSIDAPLMKNERGVTRMGVLAINAKFSLFGEYLQRMFETIFYQGQLLASKYDYSVQDYNAFVVVSFLIDKDGDINDVEVIQSSASKLANLLCKDSIESRAPYGPWTKEMVETLGDQQKITVGFYF